MKKFCFSHAEKETEASLWSVKGAWSVFYLSAGIYFIYVMFRYLTVPENGAYASPFWFIHGPVHEIGHFFFSTGYFPLVVHLLAGTVFQILTPVACGVQFLLRKEFPPLAIMLGWLGFSILDVSVYMRDARQLELPLVSPFSRGGETIHDWNWLFHYFGCLHYAERIAGVVAFFGYVCSAFSVLLIGFLLLRGFRERKA